MRDSSDIELKVALMMVRILSALDLPLTPPQYEKAPHHCQLECEVRVLHKASIDVVKGCIFIT